MAEKKVKRFWFDPRFAIGLVLVVASVAGVSAIVTTADSSVTVYAARSALSPGDRIDAGDLVLSSVRLQSTDLYLTTDDVPDDGLVVTRAISAGELVPASAVGATAGTTLTSVVVTVNGQLPASVGPGSLVDVWASREVDGAGFGPPAVVVSGATVVRLVTDSGIVVDDSGGAIEILIPRSRVARVLEAIANDDSLSVVPVSLPAKD